jgi:hypothetical protein
MSKEQREQYRKEKLERYLEQNRRETEMENIILRLMRGELIAVPNPNRIGVNNGITEQSAQGPFAAMAS